MTSFSQAFLSETSALAAALDFEAIESMVALLARVRGRGGRLFLLGVGGSAGSAVHAANDFRKLAGLEAYCPTDNVSELTARTNDEGWDTVFSAWLAGSRLNDRDCVLVFSVGGGDEEKGVSVNLIRALEYAKGKGASIAGVVGRDGGYTARVADACVTVPVINQDRVTPHTEAYHGVIWHLMVSHPSLKTAPTKW